MRDLNDFSTPNPQPLFPDARSLPAFFEHNLIDPARVVKVFKNDPQANIRVFYYQYLKLCFDLQSVDFEGYINRIEQVINNEDFKFVFYQDDDPQIFSDLQFKSLLTQLFSILGQGNTTVQETLNRYPIIDTVMIYFYRAILILTGKTQSLDSFIDREELFGYLCQQFEVEISVHDKCIKFVETDIFVYEEDPQEVFMAYMDYDKTTEPSPQKQQQQQPAYQPQQQNYHQAEYTQPYVPSVNIEQNSNSIRRQEEVQISSSSRRGNTEMNQSYISSEFVDYTSEANLITKNALNSSGQNQRNTNTNNVFSSATIERSRPYESTNVSISNNYQPQNVFSHQEDSKPDTFSYSSQANGYKKYGLESQQSKIHNTADLGAIGSKVSDSKSSKFDLMNYDRPYVPQIPKDLEPFQKKQFEKYSSLSEFDKAPSSIGLQQKYQQQSSFTPYQPPSTGDTYRTKQSSYTSSYSESNKFTDTKPPSSQYQTEYPSSKPSSQVNKNKYEVKPPSSQESKGLSSYEQAQYMPQGSTLPLGKNPFNLNVSLEFTNSFTMKAMAEPFKTEVRSIRQRARNYRDSLISFIK